MQSPAECGDPPRRRGRPPAQSSEHTRARVLRAARVCFGHSGYGATSMADIAEAAGVTPRAIYHYVDSKAQLFSLAATAAYSRFFEEIVARVFRHDDARGRLKGFLDVFRVLYQEDPSLVAFISLAVLEASRNPELESPLSQEAWKLSPSAMLAAHAVSRGELAADVDPAGVVAAVDVFGAGLTLVASAERGGDYLAMLDVIDRMIDGTLFTK